MVPGISRALTQWLGQLEQWLTFHHTDTIQRLFHTLLAVQRWGASPQGEPAQCTDVCSRGPLGKCPLHGRCMLSAELLQDRRQSKAEAVQPVISLGLSLRHFRTSSQPAALYSHNPNELSTEMKAQLMYALQELR